MKLLKHWKIVALLCATVGLAPFAPEPHIWGKLKWVAGGAKGMEKADWLDLLFHGTPWVLLLGLFVIWVAGKVKLRER